MVPDDRGFATTDCDPMRQWHVSARRSGRRCSAFRNWPTKARSHPDFGLYAARQVQKGPSRDGQTPERGVVEVKSPEDDAWLTATGGKAGRYWERYRLVLVTNARDFVLVGEGRGRQARDARDPSAGRGDSDDRSHTTGGTTTDAMRPRRTR